MEKTEKKKKFQLPHIYVILFIFSALAAVATYIVPAGEFDRVPGPDGRETVDPESFTQIASSPVGFVDFLTIIPRGLIEAGEIIFFTFMIGGMFMVLKKTGIIEIVVDRLANRFANKSILIIPVLTTVFAFVATLIGTPELTLVYIPVILPLMIALGYDSIVAAAVALIGSVVGFTAGVLNPVNVGLSQQIVGVPLFSGIGFRVTIFVLTVVVASLFIMRYAKKIKDNPLNSYVYEEDAEKRKLYQHQDKLEVRTMTAKQKYASLAALLFMGILVYGVLNHGWFMVEMAGLFIFMGIVVGLIAGLNSTEISEGFTEGFRDVLMGAIIMGLARGVSVALEDGHIMDTIVYSLGSVVGDFPAVFGAVGMYLVQLVINFIIPSGSGQALVTMPIMGPLADIIGVTRQTAVLAFQLGDGFAHILYPTSGYFMAALAIAGVSWQKWIKFFLPLFFIFSGIGIIALIIAQSIQWTG
ncbi:YfcC family protein [Oceanobacillus polygoni]|uniref:Ion transporter superfamily protein YfcC n=1 Tax=Oceanobacillus polygoni TaxID=1235259 RepID=A0A9X0YS15_9BACI|nr:TIGR00366 family protein [Oceanobacillus polygoni]MBP2077002.1 putative ion transporter superfamily protein YfcC [Oceanobacillus polygoni]